MHHVTNFLFSEYKSNNKMIIHNALRKYKKQLNNSNINKRQTSLYLFNVVQDNKRFLETRDSNGRTPLQYAIHCLWKKKGDFEAVRTLVYGEANVDVLNDNNLSALFMFIKVRVPDNRIIEDYSFALNAMLDRSRFDINRRYGTSNDTLLKIARKNGNHYAVKRFIEEGASDQLHHTASNKLNYLHYGYCQSFLYLMILITMVAIIAAYYNMSDKIDKIDFMKFRPR